MDKKKIISIAGMLGSGKSSTGKRVAEILKYKHTSTGDFMRAMANERGVTLNELNKIAETDSSVDEAIDGFSSNIGKTEENVVIDSRLAFHFIPKSFKVFLNLDSLIAAKRALDDAKVNPARHKEAEGFDTVDNIAKAFTKRIDSERTRYKDLYNIKNHTAPENFDLVIDTATLPLEGVAQKIVDEYRKWLKN